MNPAYRPLILLSALLVLFIWNRWRYDLVAMFGLLVAVFLGIVPAENAFLGFGHPAVILVAAALLVSKGLSGSGSLNAVLGVLSLEGKGFTLQLVTVCGVTALLSGFINDIGALALMIPFVVSLAYKSGRSPKLYLMPVAFSSLLGGMMTLIGTPPNIIISSYRNSIEGLDRFTMFDYTPVGVLVALGGVVFLALIGWRLIPMSKKEESELAPAERSFLTELEVTLESSAINSSLRELSDRYPDVIFLGRIDDEKSFNLSSPYRRLEASNVLLIKASPTALKELVEKENLKLLKEDVSDEILNDSEALVVEIVIPPLSPSLGHTSRTLDVRWRYAVNILGISRTGSQLQKRLSDNPFQVGDILLLQGKKAEIDLLIKEMKWLFLSEKSLRISSLTSVLLPIGLFAVAIFISYMEWVNFTISLVSCAFIYVLLGYLKVKEIYKSIEWPIIILLACMIPIGEGMDKMGSLDLISEGFLYFGHAASPVWLLSGVTFLTLILTNIINNAAAALVMAPVAVNLAQQLKVSPDPFLIAIAMAASAAFMTPIGHQSNALVMEPGGYKFRDYALLGLPVSLLVMVVGIPAILFFWPF